VESKSPKAGYKSRIQTVKTLRVKEPTALTLDKQIVRVPSPANSKVEEYNNMTIFSNADRRRQQ
jgi:hypothetical protein